MSVELVTVDQPEPDPVGAALALHHGDARAAIAAARATLQFVHGHLTVTGSAMSQGFTRTFKPGYAGPDQRLFIRS